MNQNLKFTVTMKASNESVYTLIYLLQRYCKFQHVHIHVHVHAHVHVHVCVHVHIHVHVHV